MSKTSQKASSPTIRFSRGLSRSNSRIGFEILRFYAALLLLTPAVKSLRRDPLEKLTGTTPTTTLVDKGYKGQKIPQGRNRVLIRGTRSLTYTLKRRLRRRMAIEPEIGHMKAVGLL